MKIRMTQRRWLQDAGHERVIDGGQVYDLPANIASALIATGVAVRADEGTDAKP